MSYWRYVFQQYYYYVIQLCFIGYLTVQVWSLCGVECEVAACNNIERGRNQKGNNFVSINGFILIFGFS
jgi:hypothetical protein